ncbi:MAG TPA: DUF4159 domain-containing protein [Vicinamibacterales bacterium]
MTGRSPGRLLAMAVATALVAWLATEVEAQFRRGFGNVRRATERDHDGAFHFCRVQFRSGGGDGGNWSVDWPRADINLTVRLGELTRAHISRTGGEPNPLVVLLTDDALFQCPFVMMTEVGSIAFNDLEATRLREYVLKGGFVWADDFWGSYAWDWWESQIRQVLPAVDFPIVDLESSHPLFSSQFLIKQTPQIASINFWAGTGGGTSERGADSAVARSRAILDAQGRIMVLMTHNTDIGDSFEREGDDPQYFMTMSVPGYAYGINTLLYSLTH